jgi:arabinofuranan 3-O-arabinosyltransferase
MTATVGESVAVSTPTEAPPPPAPIVPMWRGRLALVCAGLTALAFIQDPGRIAADTKLDLNVNPGGLMSRALHLWDAVGFSGQLQNQGYGYLWPMGPFYWLGQTLGLPAWVVQRLWWALLLCAAFLGMVKLASLLGIGTRGTRIVGALAFALAPRVVSTMGAVSIESWPLAMAPWVLIPLVKGSLGGSPRKWAAWSGVAFLCIGGVNAVATMAVLPLGVWWLLTRQRSRRLWTLTGWWVASIGLASLWWLLPLLLLGQYSPPFLDWIESANVTTSVTSGINVMRGADAWLPYLVDNTGPLLPAGWELATSWWGVLATGVIAAVGAAGLAMRGLPQRSFLVGSAIIGFGLVSLGHVGIPAGIGSEEVRGLLDGALAPLRNVHKFDAVLRLPLTLGLMAALAGAFTWVGQRRVRGLPVRTMLVAVVVAVIAASALPLVQGLGTRGRSYVDVPQYWREAADYLAEQPPGRALVVPEASFGVFQWGRTNDEPFQAFGSVPWAVRDSVPLSSAGNIRMLDSIKAQLESGRGSAGLSELLWRSGFTQVVVRNDLDRYAAKSPYRSVIHSTLANSPGLVRTAYFGPVLNSFVSPSLIADEGLDGTYPAVEVYEVVPPTDGADGEQASGEKSPRVTLRDASRPTLLAGGAEAVLTAAAAGQAVGTVVVAGDPGVDALPAGRVFGTDSLRRQEVNFGAVRNNLSNTLTASGDYSMDRPVHDYLPGPYAGNSVAAFDPGVEFSASSSGGQANAARNRSAANQPWAAVDGDGRTRWLTGDYEPGVGQWWQLDLGTPVDLGTELPTVLVAGSPGAARPTAIDVTTDTGTVRTDFPATDDAVALQVPPGPTRTLRLTMLAAEPGRNDNGFGIVEVTLPTGPVARSVEPLGEGAADGWLFQATPGSRGGCVMNGERISCSADLGRAGEELAGIDRTIELSAATSFRVRATALARDTGAVDGLLTVANAPAKVTASSTLVGDPAARGAAAMDGSGATAWIANPLDKAPTLEVTLREPATISGLKVDNRIDLNASNPLGITVKAGGRNMSGFTDEQGVVRFDPVTTSKLLVTFNSRYPKTEATTGSANQRVLPVGISELKLLGAPGVVAALPAAASFQVGCGLGPSLMIDDTVAKETEAAGVIGRVLAGQPVTLNACGGDTVTIPAGRHRIRLQSTAEFAADTLSLLPTSTAPAPAGATTSPTVLDWQSANRAVEVTASPTTRTLELAENFNAGWVATLDGQRLEPVRVDGWRQAWIVPAGAAGTAQLIFEPDAGYRWGLAVGLLAALVLLGLAILRARPSRSAPVSESQRLSRWLVAGVAVVCVAATTGIVGLVLAGGVAAILMLTRLRRLAWVVAGLTVLVATVLQLFFPWPGSLSQPDWVSWAQSLLVVAALAAWVAPSFGATRRSTAAPRPPN